MFARTKLALLCLGWFVWAAGIARADDINAGTRYSGRVVYRGTKTAVPGVLIEAVEAENDGKPSDDALGRARADSQGRFTIVLTKSTDERITLVAFAVRTSAETGGDRRRKDFEIKSRRVQLGYLPDPSLAKPNVIAIEHRRPKHASGDSDDD